MIRTNIPFLAQTIFITLFSILFFQVGYSQDKISKIYLEKDLAILKSNIEKNHGGLYTYSSKKIIDDWFIQTQKNLKDSMGIIEFYRLLTPLNSVIKNGHTDIPYPKLKKDFKLLPIQLYKYKDSFYVGDFFAKGYEDLLGLQILKIDEQPIGEIYNSLLKNYTRDGDNLTFPNENLSSLFGLDYALIYGSKSNHTITISKDNKNVQIELKSTLLNDEVVNAYEESKKQKPLSFEVNNKVGVLTFSTFSERKLEKENYLSFLEESFKKIKHNTIEHLIIDVRDNSGGDALPTQELLSYLLDKEFVMYKDVYTITKKIKDKKYYSNQGVFWLNTFSWLKLKKTMDNHYSLRKIEGMDVFSPKKDNFKGKLYILINGKSFSATGEFTSFLKNNRNVIFIGEEVGGNKVQNTSGISYVITLPYSKQKVKIPLVVWEMNVDYKNDSHGIKPDYWIRNTIDQELNDYDSVLNFTLEFIKNR